MGYKKTLISSALSLSLIWVAVACNPNQNQGLKVGSLVSDGNTVSSTGTLGAYNLNLGIGNITSAGAGQTTSYTYLYGQAASTNYRVDVVLGGYPTTLVFAPTIYSFSNAFYGVQTGYNTKAMTYFGSYVIYYEGKCSTATCETLYLNIIIGYNGYGTEAKQIGIKKSMTTNKITAISEANGDLTTLVYKPTDTVIQGLTNNTTM
jgi:hypothetical protein